MLNMIGIGRTVVRKVVMLVLFPLDSCDGDKCCTWNESSWTLALCYMNCHSVGFVIIVTTATTTNFVCQKSSTKDKEN